MALNKIDVPISFGQGIDTKTDPKQVVTGKLLQLQNARYKSLDSFVKRDGYEALSPNIISSGSISTGVGIANFQNQLNLFDGSSLYSYNGSTETWSPKGSLVSTTFQTNPVIKNIYSQTVPDSAFNSASPLSVYAWEDSSGGVRYSVIDQETGDPIIDNSLVSLTGSTPRVASVGNFLVIFYVDSNQIQYKSISNSTPALISSASTVTSDLNASFQIFDVVVSNSKIFIGYTNTSPSIAFYSLSSSLVLSSPYTVGSDSETAISLTTDSSNNIWASYYDGTTVKSLIVNNALNSTVLSPTDVETVSNIVNIASAVIGTTGSVFYEVQGLSSTVIANGTAVAGNFTGNSNSLGVGDNTQLAQPFVAAASGSLFDATVYINNVSSLSTGNFNLGIYTNSGGVPGTLVSDLVSIPISSITSGSFNPYIFSLTTAGFLNSGTTYFVVLSTSGTQIVDISDSSVSLTNPDMLLSSNNGATWAVFSSGFNFEFEVDVFSTTTIFTPVPTQENIRTNTITLSGTVGTPSVLIRSLGLASKAFVYDSEIYLVGSYSSSLQGKYFLLNGSGQVISRFSGEPNLGSGLTTKSLLSSIWNVSTGVYQLAYLQVDAISFSQVENQGVFTEVASTQNGVMQGLFSFGANNSNTFSSLSLGNNLNITGGLPTIYDGNNVVEQGFNLYPENLNAELSVCGGGLGSGPYQYSAIYQWTDNQGQLNQSAPSVAVTVPLKQVIVNGSTNSNGTVSTVSDVTQIAPGFLVSATQNNDIPADTTVATVSSGQFTLSANATSSNSGELITITPQLNIECTTTTGSDIIQMASVPTMYICGDIVASSTSMTLHSLQNVKVGQTITDNLGLISGKITALNGNDATFNGFIPSLNSPNSVIGVQNIVTGTLSGTTSVSSVSSADLALLQVGMTVTGTDIQSGTTITAINVGAGTFTLNQTATGSASDVAITANFFGAGLLYIGQTVTDTSSFFPAQTTIIGFGITFITPGSNFNGPQVKISNQCTGSDSSDTLITQDILSGFVTIPTLRITSKQNSVAPVNIAVYRTTDVDGVPGTTFFLVNNASNPLLNSTTVDYVTFDDIFTDSIIENNTELYTTGSPGEVANTAVPPHNLSVIYNNREIIVPDENRLSFWYAKQVIPGFPIEFSDSFINNIDPRGGDVTAIGVMDDKLIMFKENIIFYLSALGPASNGTNNDFTSGTQIVTPVGCSNQKSIVQMPNGLMFQASNGNGIWLLTRDLGTTYVGADVEAYNSYTVTSAQLVPNATEVRFTLSNGTILVYDYFVGKWNVDLSLSAVDSCLFQNLFTFLNSNGTVYQEAPGTYTDNGAFIPLGLTTSWLSFAGIQSFQRVYEFLIFGQWYSAHNLQVQLAYNFNSSVVQTDTLNAQSSLIPYQFRVFPEIQKCEAVQITLTEQQSGSFGQGLSLSGFNFIIGKKKGHYKMPASQSYG